MMQTTSTIPITAPVEPPWVLPHRGIVGMACLIIAESAIFLIFVVAYIYYIGKSLSGPMPAQVLELPILGTICLLSSSITIHFAVSGLRKNNIRDCTIWLAGTVLLGAIFLMTTAREWYHLIHDVGLTIRTNLIRDYVLFAGRTACDSRRDRVDHVDDCARAAAERTRERRSMRNGLRCCRSTGTLSMACGLLCFWWCTCSADSALEGREFEWKKQASHTAKERWTTIRSRRAPSNFLRRRRGRWFLPLGSR